MDEQEKLQRVLGVFQDRGWKSRDDILSDHDQDAKWEAVRDIGPAFAPVMRQLMQLNPAEWTAATRLPYYGWEDPDVDAHIGEE